MEVYGGEGPGSVSVGRFRVDDGYEVDRPQGRGDWLVTFTLEGEGFFRTPQGERSVGAGDVAVLKAVVPHRYGTKPGARWHFVWAHFPLGAMEPILLPDAETSVRSIASVEARRRILRAFRRALGDAASQGPFWNELCLSALQEALAVAGRSDARRLDPRVEETLRLLSARRREPVRVEALAAEVGLSPSRLSHLFKEATGQSIVDALNAMRVREAALLLEHSRLGAAEIAYDVGFQNYNHFLAQFRKRLGASPSEYRQRLRNMAGGAAGKKK